MVCIGQAHAFSDANKRTALLAVLCYLLAQGIEMKPLPAAFSDHVVACIMGELTEQHFARLLALYQKNKEYCCDSLCLLSSGAEPQQTGIIVKLELAK